MNCTRTWDYSPDAGMLFGHTKILSPLRSQFDAHTSLQSYQFLFGPEVAIAPPRSSYRPRSVLARTTPRRLGSQQQDSLSLIGRTHFCLGRRRRLDVNFKEHFDLPFFQALPFHSGGRQVGENNYRVSTASSSVFKSLHGLPAIHAFVMRRAGGSGGRAIHALHFPGVVADYCS